MLKEAFFQLVLAAWLSLAKPVGDLVAEIKGPQIASLTEQTLSLSNRSPIGQINQIFTDNILLNLRYLAKQDQFVPIDWDQVHQAGSVHFWLKPGEIFAFHETVYPEFAHPAVTMNSRYSVAEGYLVLSGLAGNGVCHLASLMNQAAHTAGLKVVADVRHDFAPVPGIESRYGTSIRSGDARQNLYIRNILTQPVIFWFDFDQQSVKLRVLALAN